MGAMTSLLPRGHEPCLRFPSRREAALHGGRGGWGGPEGGSRTHPPRSGRSCPRNPLPSSRRPALPTTGLLSGSRGHGLPTTGAPELARALSGARLKSGASNVVGTFSPTPERTVARTDEWEDADGGDCDCVSTCSLCAGPWRSRGSSRCRGPRRRPLPSLRPCPWPRAVVPFSSARPSRDGVPRGVVRTGSAPRSPLLGLLKGLWLSPSQRFRASGARGGRS